MPRAVMAAPRSPPSGRGMGDAVAVPAVIRSAELPPLTATVTITAAATIATTVAVRARLDTTPSVGFPAERRVSGASASGVGDPVPGRLGTELDRLRLAVRLHVAEGLRAVAEDDVQLALLDPLVQPGGAEHEPAQPVHERAVRRPDDVRPAVVDVLAEAGRRVLHLAVDRQVDEVLELGRLEAPGDEPELDRRLLDALGEVALVEREAQLPVFEHVVLAGVVVPASQLVHGGVGIVGVTPAPHQGCERSFTRASRRGRRTFERGASLASPA